MADPARVFAGLIFMILAFTVMLRPLAPGFANGVNQQLGNCVGRVICFVLMLLFLKFICLH